MEPELDNTDLSEFVTGFELDESLQTPEFVDRVCKEINLDTRNYPQPIFQLRLLNIALY